jgi:hypothetical protein
MGWLDDFAGQACTMVNDRVLKALAERGVSEEDARLFRIGYIDGKLPPGVDCPVPFRAWCVGGRKLIDSYVFPMTNTIGQIRGFQFRSVDRKQKDYRDYIEDPKDLALFGLSQAMPHLWEQKSVFLVEGTFDVFPVRRHFPGVIPTMTAGATDPLLRILRRLVHEVWLGYDMDTPGRRSCSDFTRKHGKDFTCHTVVYPRPTLREGKTVKDPSDLWEVVGPDGVGRFMRALLGS